MTKRIGFLQYGFLWMGLFGIAAGLNLFRNELFSQANPVYAGVAEKVRLVFDVYNHTQGHIRTFTRDDATVGSEVNISILEMNVSGVDNKHIILRGPLANCRYISFSNTGELVFTILDSHREAYGFHYAIFLLNSSNHVKYALLDKQKAALRFPPHATYHRGTDQFKDSLVRKELFISSLAEALQGINDALQFPWIVYGSLTEVDQDGNFEISFERIEDKRDFRRGWGGYDGKKWYIRIRTDAWIYPIKAFCTEEIVEIIGCFEDLGGTESYFRFTDRAGSITPAGRDLLAYVFVKSPKTLNVAPGK